MAELAEAGRPFWFCLKAAPKREHLAATALRRELQVPVVAPRIRFRKLTSRGPVWFVEAMFPGYLFAEFIYRRTSPAGGSYARRHGTRALWGPCADNRSGDARLSPYCQR